MGFPAPGRSVRSWLCAQRQRQPRIHRPRLVVWAGLGTAGAALLGPVFFHETLTLAKAFWLVVIVVGVVWLKLADSPALEAKKTNDATR